MTLESYIIQQLNQNLNPHYLLVENISYLHTVPHGAETHFKIFVVSDSFMNKKNIDRQRSLHSVLVERMPQIHSITQKTLTISEWTQLGSPKDFDVPECFGGKKV